MGEIAIYLGEVPYFGSGLWIREAAKVPQEGVVDYDPLLVPAARPSGCVFVEALRFTELVGEAISKEMEACDSVETVLLYSECVSMGTALRVTEFLRNEAPKSAIQLCVFMPESAAEALPALERKDLCALMGALTPEDMDSLLDMATHVIYTTPSCSELVRETKLKIQAKEVIVGADSVRLLE